MAAIFARAVRLLNNSGQDFDNGMRPYGHRRGLVNNARFRRGSRSHGTAFHDFMGLRRAGRRARRYRGPRRLWRG